MKKFVNKALASVLALTLLLGLLPAGVLAADSTAGAAPVTINVADYFTESHEVNGVKEATTALARALAHAKTLDKSVQKTITFPKGEYHFYADYAEKRELYVSNTVGTNPTHKIKHIGILVEDMENVTIDGGGSMFIYHGDITEFAVIRSKNVKFINFDTDHASPSVVDVTVEYKVPDENAVIALVPADYTYTISGTTITWKGEVGPVTGQPYWQGTNDLTYAQIYDTISGKTWRGDTTNSPLFSGVTKIEDLGGNRLKFTYSGGTPQVGLCFQMRNTTRTTPGSFFWESDGITVQNVNIHFLHGFGFVGQLSKNITLDNVDFRTRPESGRTTAGFADFVQMSSVGGKITISNCDFSNPHDDPINIHGTFLTVDTVSADKKTFTLKYRHGETGGFPQYYVGDQVDFSTKGTMIPVTDSLRTVTEVVQPGTGGLDLNTTKITLDAAVEGIAGGNEGHVVENVTYTPEVLIENNRFIETPTRGILVTTRKPVVIQNNYFDGMGMSSIFISCDAAGWYESGRTENVLIKGNVFDRTSESAIFVQPTGNTGGAHQVHKNMVIEENIFNMQDGSQVVNAKSVDGLTIRNNTIQRYLPNVQMNLTAGQQSLAVGNTQATTLTSSGTQRSQKLYRFEDCRNVKIENNKYDAGLNQGIEFGRDCSAADVTVVGDELTKGSNNQKPAVGTVLYMSSNPAVASVNASGVVRGISAGSADIFAYTLSGARVFTSQKLTFTVTAGTPVVDNSPAQISVTPLQSSIAADATLQMTATAAPADKSNAVTWSVRNAANQSNTDCATISNAGLLTAAKPGVVEVLATSQSNSQVVGSCLVTILKPTGGLNEAWTVNRNTGSWTVNEDGSLTITAQNGGDWHSPKEGSNFFLTNEPAGDYSFTVTLNNKTSGATNNWEEGGLVVFNDGDNYVSLVRKNNAGTPKIAINSEKNQAPGEGTPLSDIAGAVIHFRLTKTGSAYKGEYSANGTTWAEVRTVTDNLLTGNTKIGFFACSSPNNTNFTFQDFKIDNNAVPFLGTNTAPTATNAAIAANGSTMTLNYTYTDAESDSETGSLYRWYAAETETGIYMPIAGAYEKTFTTTAAQSGQYLKAAVVPVDAKGRAGAPVMTATAVQAPSTQTQADATLSTLELLGVPLSPAFAATTTEYTVSVPAMASTLHLRAEATQAGAQVAVTQDGATVSDGVLTLNKPTSTVEITVTAPDITTTKVYTITLHSLGSADTALSSLTLGNGFTFEPGKQFYQLLADTSVQNLTLSAAMAQTGGKLRVRFNHEVLSDYTASSISSLNLALKPGLNALEIMAKAEDGISTKLYRVSIVKTPSSEAHLSGITLGGTALTGFGADTMLYKVPAAAGALQVVATPKDSGATVQMKLGSSLTDGNLTLAAPLTTLTIRVTAADRSTVKTYTLHLIIPTVTNAALLNMTTGELAISPAFAPETLSYTASTAKTSFALHAEAVESSAIITAETDSAMFRGTGSLTATIPLSVGANNLEVTVRAPDGSTTKTYTIVITVHQMVYLTDLPAADWLKSEVGWGSLGKDVSVDGNHIRVLVGGVNTEFPKGIGAHATSTIEIDLTDKGYNTFFALAGIDQEVGNDAATITFVVSIDGTEKWRSSKEMTRGDNAQEISLPIPSDAKKLTLFADMGAGDGSDHADWADAKFLSTPPSPVTKYAVTLTPVAGLDLWADLKQAQAGDLVTVHVDANTTGRDLAGINVTDADGAVTVTTVNATTYTFVMPAKAVTVAAQLAPLPTWPVTLTQGTGYTLAGADNVETGKDYTFTLTLDAAYSKAVPVVQVNGTVLAAKTTASPLYTYEILAVAAAKTVTVDALAKNTYTVTFKNGTETVSTKTVTHGETLTTANFPAVSAKPGYNGAWSVIADITNVTADQVVNAEYTAKTYTVSFDANGGNAVSETMTITYGAAYGTLPTPTTAEAKNFAGWFTAATEGTQVTAATLVTATADHTLYAHWTAQDASAAPNATISGMPATVTLPYSDAITLSVTAASTYAYQWQYSTDGTTWVNLGTAATQSIPAADVLFVNSGRQYRCTITNTQPSKTPTTVTGSPVTLTVTKGAQDAPAVTGGEGKITGLLAAKAYEYKLTGATEYTSVSAITEITGLTPGTYLVRLPGDDNYAPSADASVTVTAVKYAVTVTNGTGAGQYVPGTTVTITANAPVSGKVFDKWTTTDGVAFASATSAETTFVMPAKAVAVTATYLDIEIPSYDPPAPKPEAPKTDADGNVSVTVPVKPSNNGSSSSGTVSDKTMTDAIHSAVKEAEKTSATANVELKVSAPETAQTVNVTISKKSLSAVAESKAEHLIVTTPLVEIKLDSKALTAVSAAAGSKVRIIATRVAEKELSPAQKAQVGGVPVYDLSIMSGNDTISDFGGGKATITIPYALKDGQDAAFVTVWYLSDAGKLELISGKYENGKVTFTVDHFSRYAVGYLPFTDVQPDWAYESIVYAYSANLFGGVGKNQFAPTTSMTRSMVWSVLYRMAGEPGKTDAKLWYADAQAWAIAEKISDGKNPTGDVTRQELATILYRYAKAGAVQADLSSFTDTAEIAAFAKDGMHWAVSSGILNGNHGKLNPMGNASRAEVAAMLQRFAAMPK